MPHLYVESSTENWDSALGISTPIAVSDREFLHTLLDEWLNSPPLTRRAGRFIIELCDCHDSHSKEGT